MHSAERGETLVPQDKRIPMWLTIDLVVLAGAAVIIGIGMWIGPW
jgi:hypothetical protein